MAPNVERGARGAMTSRSSLSNLGRVGAATAAVVALLGLGACLKLAPAANNTTAPPANTVPAGQSSATNGAGLGASTGVPGAPVAPLAPLTNGMGAPPGPGGMAGPGPAGQGPGPGSLGGATGATGPGGGSAPGGPPSGGDQGGPPSTGDQSANDDYDKNFINACFHSAVQKGNSIDAAAHYCTCAMGELDRLNIRQKQSLTGSSPEVLRAEQDCQGGAS